MNGLDAYDESDMLEILQKAKAPFVTCSWGIMSIRRKSTGQWTTLMMFFDDATRVPFFIFDFDGDTVALHAMAARLIKTKD